MFIHISECCRECSVGIYKYKRISSMIYHWRINENILDYSPNFEYDELEDDNCWHMQTLVTPRWSVLLGSGTNDHDAMPTMLRHRLHFSSPSWSTAQMVCSWYVTACYILKRFCPKLIYSCHQRTKKERLVRKQKNNVSECCPSSIGSWWPRHRDGCGSIQRR